MPCHRRRPLSDHPELSIIEYPGYREYRVEHPRTLKHGKWLHSLATAVPTHALLVPLLSLYWKYIPSKYVYSICALLLVLICRSTFSQLLYESVILLPPHGIQLETHRGLTGMRPLFSKRIFIPAISLQDIIINEGLKGWNVLYYLVAVRRSDTEGSALEVAFEDLLPSLPVLLEVFEGIHELMMSNTTSVNAMNHSP